MNVVQIPSAVAVAVRSDPSHKPDIAVEIHPIERFEYSYTKVRLDTGEIVWRWPNAPPRGTGSLLDLRV